MALAPQDPVTTSGPHPLNDRTTLELHNGRAVLRVDLGDEIWHMSLTNGISDALSAASRKAAR